MCVVEVILGERGTYRGTPRPVNEPVDGPSAVVVDDASNVWDVETSRGDVGRNEDGPGVGLPQEVKGGKASFLEGEERRGEVRVSTRFDLLQEKRAG